MGQTYPWPPPITAVTHGSDGRQRMDPQGRPMGMDKAEAPSKVSAHSTRAR